MINRYIGILFLNLSFIFTTYFHSQTREHAVTVSIIRKVTNSIHWYRLAQQNTLHSFTAVLPANCGFGSLLKEVSEREEMNTKPFKVIDQNKQKTLSASGIIFMSVRERKTLLNHTKSDSSESILTLYNSGSVACTGTPINYYLTQHQTIPAEMLKRCAGNTFSNQFPFIGTC